MNKVRINLDWSLLAARYAQGFSLKKLSLEFGVGATTIWKRLVENGVIMRKYPPLNIITPQERSHNYYLAHKRKIIARSKRWAMAHPKRYKKMARKSLEKHRVDRIATRQHYRNQPHAKLLTQKWNKKNRKKILRQSRLRSHKRYRQHPEIWREDYLKRRPEILSAARIRRLDFKLRVFDHYSNGDPKCACCGESEFMFLSLDHINGNGNKERKKLGNWGIASNFYVYLIKHDFPPGYQVLCMNCNFAKGTKGVCPHKTRFMVQRRTMPI